MSADSSATNAASTPNKAAEVGWLFVPQYYTLMNSDPSRLHCFYTKKSAMVHADENEDTTASVGQQDIHAKIQSLGFENTKVYVSNVDSQSSADGGIVIQVLGEMSNKNGPWRKFAQTFFLAQQPNGYYVLNDIFRYLKDEADEVDTAAAAAPVEVAEAANAPDSVADTVAETLAEPSEATPAATAEKAAEATAEASAPAAEPAAASAAAPTAEPTAKPAPAAEPKAPAAPKPAAPKTWANLAASNANKWGVTASESRGTSETPAAAPTPSPSAAAPSKPAAAPKSRPAAGAAGGHVFVKNVPAAQVSQDELRKALESQFGTTKECQLNAAKGFAFVEFASPDAARKAIAASADGGVKVLNATVLIEKRRPAERGAHGGRGGRGGHAHRGGALHA